MSGIAALVLPVLVDQNKVTEDINIQLVCLVMRPSGVVSAEWWFPGDGILKWMLQAESFRNRLLSKSNLLM
jgi:hypothetical protein